MFASLSFVGFKDRFLYYCSKYQLKEGTAFPIIRKYQWEHKLLVLIGIGWEWLGLSFFSFSFFGYPFLRGLQLHILECSMWPFQSYLPDRSRESSIGNQPSGGPLGYHLRGTLVMSQRQNRVGLNVGGMAREESRSKPANQLISNPEPRNKSGPKTDCDLSPLIFKTT